MFPLISLYIISCISKLSSFCYISRNFLSFVSGTSFYLYIFGREGDIDRKISMPITVLSVFKFPFQCLPTNRPKFYSYIEPFYPVLEEISCLENCRYFMLPHIIGCDINQFLIVNQHHCDFDTQFTVFRWNFFSIGINHQTLIIRPIIHSFFKENSGKGKSFGNICLNHRNTEDALFIQLILPAIFHIHKHFHFSFYNLFFLST